MEKINCKECGNPFIRTEGRGGKKYCSVTCRDRNHHKSNKKTFKHIGTIYSRQVAIADISNYIKECDSFFNANYLYREKDVMNLKIFNE